MADLAALTESQRRSIGVSLSQIQELAGTARAYDVPVSALTRLEDAVEALREASDAIIPVAPKNVLNAAVAQMRVLAEELRPSRLRAYGAIEPDVAAEVDVLVQRLVDAVSALHDRPV
ncbi:MAG: hypothetical protein ACRDM1_14025 [Gaiellaceae bacterium]